MSKKQLNKVDMIVCVVEAAVRHAIRHVKSGGDLTSCLTKFAESAPDAVEKVYLKYRDSVPSANVLEENARIYREIAISTVRRLTLCERVRLVPEYLDGDMVTCTSCHEKVLASGAYWDCKGYAFCHTCV